MKSTQSLSSREKVFLVGVSLKRGAGVRGGAATASARESLAELETLAESAGAVVTGSMLQVRGTLDPATLMGRGKLEEVKVEAEIRDAQLIIVDRNLTPAQLRNMEDATDCRVIDRTQLILDIFARRARTREGHLQVELAQLNYLLPRLSGRGVELSRLGGGIGTRGPGEQKLETDRRRIRDRVGKLREAIDTVRRQRTTRRQARQAVPIGTVALVGYTNAGKSTLFNALTHSDVLVSAKMFATLDPTLRAVTLPSRRKVLLSDTVGFLRDLPLGLIAAFRATLEEVQESMLLLLVTDASHPQHAEQDAEVRKILEELDVADRPCIHVLNKADHLSAADQEIIRATSIAKHGSIQLGGAQPEFPNKETIRHSVLISAKTGEGLPELLAMIDKEVPMDRMVRAQVRVPIMDSRRLAMVHAAGKVFTSEIVDEYFVIDAEMPESLALRLSETSIKNPKDPSLD
jgi:GTP-binding protein HflX